MIKNIFISLLLFLNFCVHAMDETKIYTSTVLFGWEIKRPSFQLKAALVFCLKQGILLPELKKEITFGDAFNNEKDKTIDVKISNTPFIIRHKHDNTNVIVLDPEAAPKYFEMLKLIHTFTCTNRAFAKIMASQFKTHMAEIADHLFSVVPSMNTNKLTFSNNSVLGDSSFDEGPFVYRVSTLKVPLVIPNWVKYTLQDGYFYLSPTIYDVKVNNAFKKGVVPFVYTGFSNQDVTCYGIFIRRILSFNENRRYGKFFEKGVTLEAVIINFSEESFRHHEIAKCFNMRLSSSNAPTCLRIPFGNVPATYVIPVELSNFVKLYGLAIQGDFNYYDASNPSNRAALITLLR